MSDLPDMGVNLLTEQNILHRFDWLNKPARYSFDNNLLKLTTKANTDLFRPIEGLPRDNACILYFPVSGDFTVQTHLYADLVSPGDAGSLIIRYSPERWAKLCVERTHGGDINIVTVVTDSLSDDANSELLSEAVSFLRITRVGETIGMHHSQDGLTWRFSRKFHFKDSDDNPLIVGIQAQSPGAKGCNVTFDLLQFSDQVIGDFKSGE